MGLSANDPRPQHQQIADDLRSQIAGGVLTPGDRLPTIKDLTERYGVYNQAVQLALKSLQAEGLTEGVPGRGTFVRQDIDASEISHEDPSEIHSEEYLALRSEIEKLADAIGKIEERMTKIEKGEGRRTKRTPSR